MARLASVNYHLHRPHRQAYRIDAGGVGELVSPEHARTEVVLEDVRAGEAQVSFAADGLSFEHAPTVATLPTSAEAAQADRSWMASYDAQLRSLLTRTVGAREVQVFDHTVRVDDPSTDRRPARNVHTDYSPEGAHQRLIDLLGEREARAWAAGHYAFINVWRPLGGPILSAPLAFVRPASVQAEDWLLLDLVYPDRVGQIMGLVASEGHEWIYRSRMTPDEVAVFNIYDNRGRPPVAHSAVDLHDDGDAAVRRSLESRALIRY